jgi:Spy/CpxP family protein refolding chaperone
MSVRNAVRFILLILSVAFGASASNANAQQQRAGVPRDSLGGPRRAQLEQRFRERMAEVVRRRLNLNADQMTRLQSVDRSFDSQRMGLAAREREARRSLRESLMRDANPDQARVSQLLDQMLRVQRQRLDLVESEQRELAKFLTPVQRARYLGLQNQLRRRMQELQQRPPMRRPGMQRRGRFLR